MPRSLARLSASAPSHRDLSLAVFITNIAESDFRYTQDSSAGFVPRFRLMHEPPADIPRQPALRTLPSCRGTRKSGCWLPLAIGESRRLLKRPMRPARAPASIVRADYPALATGGRRYKWGATQRCTRDRASSERLAKFSSPRL